MKHASKFYIGSLLCAQALFLAACSGSGNGSNDGGSDIVELGMPEALTVSLLDSSSGAYYSYDTTTGQVTDLNETAMSSEDSAVQALQITDTSTIGHFLHWPDFREVDEEEVFDAKYLLMVPGYEPGSTIDSDQFVQLVHFHDDVLAAHAASEFSDPEEGSSKEAALARLNAFVAEQQELEDEVAEAMEAEGQQLCRAFVDPYLAFELEHEHEEEEEAAEEEEEHEHGELVHFALSDTGRVYFFEEGEAGLESTQGFVSLDEVSGISDCDRTTIVRASDDGVLIFVPDTQMFYLVDSHGADFHQHSVWDASAILPAGMSADLVAIIGEGSEHDHDDE